MENHEIEIVRTVEMIIIFLGTKCIDAYELEELGIRIKS